MNLLPATAREYWRQDGTPARWRRALAAILAVLVPLLLYLPTLGYGYIYDDLPLVAQNEAIRSIDAAIGYFHRDFDAYTRGWEGTQSNYYRPLVFLFMALLWPWTGDDPARWHAVVIMLNAIVGGLAFAILRLHGLSLARALFGSLLFSLHPMHVHSAAWITGLHDVLAAVFVLLGYTGLARWLELDRAASSAAPRVASLALFVASLATALLIKESSVALGLLAMLLGAWSGTTRPDLRVRAIAIILATVVTLVTYLLLRWNILGAFASPFPGAPAWPEAIASIGPLFLAYLAAWLWPVDLSLFSRFRPVVSVSDPMVLASWTAALVLAGVAWVAIRRQRAWLYPILFFGCLLAPHMNLRVLNPEWALMHRYLYLPSLGLAWMIALLPVLRSARLATTVAATSLLAVLAVGTVFDMRAYRDEASFWDKAVRKDPGSSAAWTEQGRLLAQRGDAAGARQAWERAGALDPRNLLPRLRLGNLKFAARDYAGAAADYRAIIALSPGYPPAWRNLPSALLGAGDRDGALRAGREALQRFPQDVEVLTGVGTVRKLGGDLRGATDAYAQLVLLRPRDPMLHLRLATLQAEMGATSDARRSLAAVNALTRDPALLEASAQLMRQLESTR